jgi:hypothetical protein
VTSNHDLIFRYGDSNEGDNDETWDYNNTKALVGLSGTQDPNNNNRITSLSFIYVDVDCLHTEPEEELSWWDRLYQSSLEEAGWGI